MVGLDDISKQFDIDGSFFTSGNIYYFAAHAVVVNISTGQEETAWGEGTAFNAGSGNWAMYFTNEQ